MSDTKKDDEALRALTRSGMGDVKQADRTLDERIDSGSPITKFPRAEAQVGRDRGDLAYELKGRQETRDTRDDWQKLFPHYPSNSKGRSR